MLNSGIRRLSCRNLEQQHSSKVDMSCKLDFASECAQQVSEDYGNYTEMVPNENRNSQSCSFFNEEVELDWEQKVRNILQKHFGFSSLKGFQKKALEAWFANRDSLVLAATGSGKSLCFQIPALLTNKIVIVISPLISLMHDQCLKLAKHGVSACFLVSGQPDRTIEYKAMCGMYKIVYVCPETIIRIVEPLRRLAVNPGIALFAVDEVHCVSKWGHDFRPDYRVWKHIIKKLVELGEMENSQIVLYMRIYHEFQHSFLVKEVMSRQNKHRKCYLIVSGMLWTL